MTISSFIGRFSVVEREDLKPAIHAGPAVYIDSTLSSNPEERNYVVASRSKMQVIRSQAVYTGKQAFTYRTGVAAENTGARGICMHLLNIPPGERARAHLHEGHETAVYVISGRSGMWYGDSLEEHMCVNSGDFVYIPPGVPHLPYNPSETETCTVVIARTDPNEQESVRLLPELDGIHS